ncbi:MAG: hypothetical protein KAJ03_02640 [Gammaproteobacteria bacterium]|nr:hypothetical protein [Gammaproteobacteria bacterium]
MLSDRELLISLATDIDYIKKSIEDMKRTSDVYEITYNKRISKLERWQANVVGLSVGISAVIGWGISLLRG